MKQKIKYGINFIQLGALEILTAKLRYAVKNLSNQCVADVWSLKEKMKKWHSVEVSIRQDQKYIVIEFACACDRMVLHMLQRLQYEIASRRLARRFDSMHEFHSMVDYFEYEHMMEEMKENVEAAEIWQQQYEKEQVTTTEKTVNGKTYMLHKPEAEL